MGRMVAQTGDRACLLQWAYDAGIIRWLHAD
jgi:hypothetical protein